MSHFIIVGPDSDHSAITEAVFADVVRGDISNAEYIAPVYPKKGDGISYEIFRRFSKPEWHGFCVPDRIRFAWEIQPRQIVRHIRKGERNIIVFCAGTKMMEKVQPSLIAFLRRRAPQCKLVYYQVDGIERNADIRKVSVKSVLDFFSQFDKVFTYDRADSEKYGIPFAEIPVMTVAGNEDRHTDYDVFFCGRAKGRVKLLEEIDGRLSAEGGKGRYLLTSITDEVCRANPSFEHIEWITYPNMIEEQRKANCILEILAEGNSGTTLRYKEAILYGQKLLSNNPQLEKLPGYDSRWMRSFKSVDDIDFEWARRREPVSYDYKGGYSVEDLLKTIENNIAGCV